MSEADRRAARLRAALGREPAAEVHRTAETGFRTYEVHQRERAGQSTEKLKNSDFLSPEFLADPYPLLTILREHYPCYRNWLANDYWVTRYDDVTSIFVDDANFETRPRRWFYGLPNLGRDLRGALPVLWAQARGFDAHVEAVAEQLAAELRVAGGGDLATGFAARLPLELLVRTLDIPEPDRALFAERYWRMMLGAGWEPRAQQAGLAAVRALSVYFDDLLADRREAPADDLVSAIATLDLDDGPARGADVVATLLEGDHETLHGGLANMWMQLLLHPDQLARAREEPRALKLAWLETLRHSPPVLTARRFARHEVERFGRLLPEGALIQCSAAAANRDPRVFEDPERFDIGRKDLCQREPRGQYRADGLCSGIAFGLGAPSKHPAEPEDRPRSLYALTRDVAVTASLIAHDMLPGIRLAAGAQPKQRALRLGEMYACWALPVTFDR